LPGPVVAIVGRPNVGKSTLFNRIVGRKAAIVESKPGVTRDSLYMEADWAGYRFTVVDTGGLEFGDIDELKAKVRRQAEISIEEAQVILFVVDARAGLTSMDEEVAEIMRRTKKPVILVANKVEKPAETRFYEFYKLGLGEPIPVSAAEGLNTGDLLDRVVELLPAGAEKDYDIDTVKIAVLGRPNVGKSTFVNAVLNKERVIVSDIPGTTRDAVDTFFKKDGKSYVIIDTAGIRRRGKIKVATEKYSVSRALRAADRCDVAIIILDAVEGITMQDKRIAGYVQESGKGIIIVVNKWDLLKKDEKTMQNYNEVIRQELTFLRYAPIVYTSAIKGQRVRKVLKKVDCIFEQYTKRIGTGNLNEFIREVVLYNPPPAEKGKRLRIYYAVQNSIKPPTFVLFVNNPKYMHFSYERYLENKLRETFGFKGTPIRFLLRKRDRAE